MRSMLVLCSALLVSAAQADDYADFARAFQRKLLKEIKGDPLI